MVDTPSGVSHPKVVPPSTRKLPGIFFRPIIPDMFEVSPASSASADKFRPRQGEGAMAKTARACLVAVATVTGAVTGCGSVQSGQPAVAVPTSATPSDTAPVTSKPIPTPSRSPGPPNPIDVNTSGPGPQFPAAIASGTTAQPFTGQVELRNEWGTADGTSLVEVDAGASNADLSDGIFAILRNDEGNQSLKFVRVPGSGAVWITQAPLGASVETSGQTADLVFNSESGETGILHLSDNTVAITGQATASPIATN